MCVCVCVCMCVCVFKGIFKKDWKEGCYIQANNIHNGEMASSVQDMSTVDKYYSDLPHTE